MSDWHPNHLGFDSAAAMSLIKSIIDFHMDELSMFLQRVARAVIVAVGNGSRVMRLFAAGVVEETKREISDDHALLEVGIKMDELPEDGFVRVSVVLTGNQGGGALMTKPGVSTWKKDVIGRGMSTAKTSYPLPAGFNQGSKLDGILDMVLKNVENDSQKYVNAFIRNVNNDIRKIDFSQFITGG